jgi:hypothetical protein
VRTLLYEAANVMLTRYKGQLKLKDWAFAIARRSTMRKARVALARRLAIIMHAMLRDRRPKPAPKRSDALGRERQMAPIVLLRLFRADGDFNQATPHPAYPIKCRTSTQRTQAPESVDTRKSLSPLTHERTQST